jgi:HEAT repeat protein
MYPGGHPTLAPAAEAVAQRLAGLLADRGTLSLGVARDQLVIEGVATDPKHPVLRDLATRLHHHHLGAISFARGLQWEELEEALKLLAIEPDRMGEPLGLRPLSRIATWPHLRLYPLTFDRLELVDEGPEAAEGETTGGRAAQLWVGLARAALAAEDVKQETKPEPPPAEPFAFRPEPAAPLTDAEIDAALDAPMQAGELQAASAEPAQVAHAIQSHERGTAYDQVIVGYMLQIAEELKTAGGAGALALKRKMSRVISALDTRTLERLLDMGGDLGQRRQFLLDASQGMAVDAVVDLVRAATGTGAPVSQAMLRMLAKLGHHAERGPAPRRALAESGLREQVAELLRGWELTDPNPGGYARALERMSGITPTLVAASEAQFEAEPERLLQMAVETGAVGVPVEHAVDAMLEAGRFGEVLLVLERASQQNPGTEFLASRVRSPESLARLLTAQPVDFALVDRIVAGLGEASVDPMLEVLGQSESRQVRRGIIDRLLTMGQVVAPHLAPRLGDDRWYVVRNILYLAAELPEVPSGLDATRFRHHEDPRVRREAIRVLFKHPAERTRAICTALSDQDERTQRLALAAAAEGGCPEPAVPLVIAIASDSDNDTELRVAAIRTLSGHGGRLALEALLKLTEPRRRSILDAMKASGATPEYLAALAGLGAFRSDQRARDRLESAMRGRDPAAQKVAAAALGGTT